MACNPKFWTIEEKKKLCDLLQIFPHTSYRIIAKKLQTKSEDEVRWFINNKVGILERNQTKFKTKKETVHRAPLEEWNDVAADLVSQEPCDYSANLAKVLSMISYFEDFADDSCEDNYLDYRAIYRFLSQCMLEENYENIETLGSLESSVVVDLMHSLMEVLSTRDTFVQSHVMQWKYQLMDHRDEARLSDPRLLRMAAENDFEAFVEELFKNMKENTDEDTALGQPSECSLETARSESEHSSPNPQSAQAAIKMTKSDGKATNTAEMAVSTIREQGVNSADGEVSTTSTSTCTEDNQGSTAKQPGNKTTQPAVPLALPCADAVTSSASQVSVGTGTPIVDYKPGVGRKRRHQLPSNVKEENIIRVPFPPPVNSSVSNLRRTSASSSERSGARSETDNPDMEIASVSKDNQVPLENPESVLYTRKMVSLLPNSVRPMLGAPPTKHKPGRKGKFDLETTPRTEIVVVMPPQGAKIVNPVVRSKNKFEDEMINDDVNREYYCNVLRSDCEKFATSDHRDTNCSQQKGKSTAQSKAALALAKKRLQLSRKRKFAALIKAAKERSAPCKKPKVYSLNPFCLPVSIIDLDQ